MHTEKAFSRQLNRCPLCGQRPQLQWCDSYRVISPCGMEFKPLQGDMTGHATVDRWNEMTAGVIRPQRLDEAER